MRTDDGSIIYECLNGEPGAFGVLVDKYKEGIYAFAYSKLRNFQDAQDVTQEVFLQAYRGLRSLRRWESFGFWLYRIAYARCSQWLRINSKRVDREFIEDQDSSVIDDGSLGVYRDSRLSQSLQEALDSLPEIHREVLMLRYFAGMNSKEIARAIGTSPGAIRMRLSRARAQLRKEMADMMDTAFEGQRIPAGFTLRIIEAVKRIKIHPMPRATALPWGLVAVGIIITVMSFNPQMSIPGDITLPTGSPPPAETKVLKAGEIPVDILKTSEMSVISSKQGDGNGGEPQRDPQNALMLAPQVEGGTWTQKSDMLTARSIQETCVLDGVIYTIGGSIRAGAGWTFVPTVETYDPVADIWVKKKDMPVARETATSMVDGTIYVIGGYNPGKMLSIVEAYDPAADICVKKQDMPTARNCLATCAVDGVIYAIGGHSPNTLSTVEAYDPDMNVWEKKRDMPTARTMLSTCVVDGIIYAIGGAATLNFDGDVLPTVEAYDPVKDTWTAKADMPTARRQFAIAVLDGIIYAIGGSDEFKALSVVEAYDPVADVWVGKPELPTARAVFAAAEVNGRIYTIGGTGVNGDWNDPVATVEEYTPGDWQPEAISPQGKLPTKWGEVKSD